MSQLNLILIRGGAPKAHEVCYAIKFLTLSARDDGGPLTGNQRFKRLG